MFQSVIKRKLSRLPKHEIEIVCGGCSGADQMAEEYASMIGLKSKVFMADWDKHGKAAGPMRNAEMAVYSDYLIAFWDGSSRGTKNMIGLARKGGLKVYVKRYEANRKM